MRSTGGVKADVKSPLGDGHFVGVESQRSEAEFGAAKQRVVAQLAALCVDADLAFSAGAGIG